MQTLVTLLLNVAFTPLVRVTSAAIAPIFDNLALDKAQIKDLVLKVADVMQGKTVVWVEMGIYTPEQQKEIVEGTSDVVTALLTNLQITESNADIGRLLEAVANKMVV
jgi:hypothetical protein